MNIWENLIISALALAENVVPIFVHSSNGLAVLNATEPLLNTIITNAVNQSATATKTSTSTTGGVTTSTSTTTAPAAATPSAFTVHLGPVEAA